MHVKLFKAYKGEYPNAMTLRGIQAMGPHSRISSIFILATEKGQLFQACESCRDVPILLEEECVLVYGKYKKERGKSQGRAMHDAMSIRDQQFGARSLGGAQGNITTSSGNDKLDKALEVGATILQAAGDPIGTAVGFGVEQLFVLSGYNQKFYFYGLTAKKNRSKIFNQQYHCSELAVLSGEMRLGSQLAKHVAKATGVPWSDITVEVAAEGATADPADPAGVQQFMRDNPDNPLVLRKQGYDMALSNWEDGKTSLGPPKASKRVMFFSKRKK